MPEKLTGKTAEKIAAKLLYVTASSPAEAENIATVLVEQKLVACANILSQSTSIFWWEEKVAKENETVFILKTKANLVDQTIQKIVELHSYDCPAVVVLNIEDGNPNFLNWIDKNTI
jgi:periplasmic divalent cation tolerance protein